MGAVIVNMKDHHMKNDDSERGIGFFRRFVNGTNGVISLFLAILMVPFTLVAAALIDAARLGSAVAVFDEALCNASNSTLGTYDDFLKKRFGLLALDQNTASEGKLYSADQLISQTFTKYMEENLKALSNTYKTYDVDAAGLYPLSDIDILENQIKEAQKYLLPAKIVSDGFSIDDMIKSVTSKLSIITSILNSFSAVAGAAESVDAMHEKLEKSREEIDGADDIIEEYDNAYESFKDAVDDYNDLFDDAPDADADEDELAEYNEDLSTALEEVESARNAYVTVIEKLAEKVISVGNAVKDAQSSIKSTINAGVDVVSNIASTVHESQKASKDKDISNITESRDNAKKNGDLDKVDELNDQIKELEAEKNKIGNKSTIESGVAGAGKTFVSSLDKFASEDYTAEYRAVYDDVISLRDRVRDYKVSSGTKLDSVIDLHIDDIDKPLTQKELDDINDNIGSSVAKSSFMAIMKAIVAFIKSLMSLSLDHNWELNGTLDRSKYAAIGGLPSEKMEKRGSSYASFNAYAAEDARRSNYYKSELGKHLIDSNVNRSGTADKDTSAITKIMNSAMDLIDKWDSRSIWGNLKAIGRLVGTFVTNIGSLLKDLFTNLGEKIFGNLMVPAYIAYNVPSRTTYSGKALTGSGYSLPNYTSAEKGYAFYGAELEYIIVGDDLETYNQAVVYDDVYILRFFYDLIYIVCNGEVGSIAGAAGAFTFGIGTPLVYILYALAEPFVDTIILVNGGDVPIIKNVLYLTPSGIMDFIGAFLKISLSDAVKNDIYKSVVNVMSGGKASNDYAQNYADAVSTFGGGSPFMKTLTIDYTKTLIIYMAVFVKKEKLLERLADVIQMEASYQNAVNRIDAYTFNLDKSYTCVRASGSFSANEFIKVSEFAGLDSSKRVVYRGY